MPMSTRSFGCELLMNNFNWSSELEMGGIGDEVGMLDWENPQSPEGRSHIIVSCGRDYLAQRSDINVCVVRRRGDRQNPVMTSVGGQARPGQNTPTLCAGSRSPAGVRGSRAAAVLLRSLQPKRKGLARAADLGCDRGDGRPRVRVPSAPLGRALQARACSSSCSSWLHPLESRSLRQTWRGSH